MLSRIRRLLPRRLKLCVHCRKRVAGFWVSSWASFSRRPWCWTCIDTALNRDLHKITPFEYDNH